MYNIPVKEVPVLTWLNEKGEEIVKKFNKEKGNLVLSLFNEPDTTDDLEVMLQEGMYDFHYPQENPYSDALKDVIEVGFFYFELADVYF